MTSMSLRQEGSAARIALWVLMAVMTVLFLQFMQAYVLRMGPTDWRPLPALTPFWVNTAVLLLASLAMQAATMAARRGQDGLMRKAFIAGGLLAVAFVAGQLWAWQQLAARNYSLTGSAANGFLYLLSGMHGLHVIGGLVAWALIARRLSGGKRPQPGVGLCTVYWHFLLLVWLALFTLLFLLPPETIQALCRAY